MNMDVYEIETGCLIPHSGNGQPVSVACFPNITSQVFLPLKSVTVPNIIFYGVSISSL